MGGVLLWLLCLGLTAVARAQIPGLGIPVENASPSGVERSGLVETTPVEFEGRPLFEITSPRVANRNEPGNTIPVEVRAAQIENHLEKLLLTLIEQDRGRSKADATILEAGEVRVEIVTEDGQVSLSARGGPLASPRHLLTVTSLDAEQQQTPRTELASEWRETIAESLSTAIRERRPDARRLRSELIRNCAIVIPLVHVFFFALGRLILYRQNRIRAAIQQRKTTATPAGSAHGARSVRDEWNHLRHFVTDLRSIGRDLALETQFRFLAFLRWLLFWIIFTVWAIGIAVVLNQFPQTRKVSLFLAETPLLFVAALFLAGLFNRVTDFVVDRTLANWQTNRLVDSADPARAAARISTLSSVIRALKFVIIYLIAFVWVLSQLRVIPWSLVTIGAAAALAVSFGAQNLIKDVMVGAFILTEDQFAIGDTVSVLDVTGTIEYMNLRITQIRTSDGRLVTVPNSAITKVENYSRDWSAIHVELELSPLADAEAVLEILTTLARTMAQEPEWQETILNPVQYSGVNKITLSAMTVGISMQTRPMRQAAVARELRRRLKIEIDRKHITLNAPPTVTLPD